MNLNIINPRFLAPALLLLAAALGTTGCSQSDDAPMAATTQPLNITVAPRPAFAPAGEGADTRSTVDGPTGKFAWEVGDVIYLHITFTDADNTVVRQRMKFISASPDKWDALEEWNGIDAATPIVWPLGAEQAVVRAFYTNSTVTPGSGDSFTFPDDQENGKGANMTFTETITPGQAVEIALKHNTTFLRFTGLPASQKFVIGDSFYYRSWSLILNGGPDTPPTFTTDGYGNGTVYAKLNASSSDPTFPLKLAASADENTPLYTTTLKANSVDGVYTLNGYIYDVAVSSGGDVNPDDYPDLQIPFYKGQKPNLLAIQGQTAYWVAPANVEGGNQGAYEWADLDSATMCPPGWHIPTKDELVAMTGLTAGAAAADTNHSAIAAVFPAGGTYWSVTADGSDNAWSINVKNDGTAEISSNMTGLGLSVRCVKLKK